MAARALLSQSGELKIKDKLDGHDPFAAREWLVSNIKGIGYKEASHFLRNIGMGTDMAILDIHILRNMKRLGIIAQVPSSLTKQKYMDIEEKLRRFSNIVRIPMSHLDLLFWGMETGNIFK